MSLFSDINSVAFEKQLEIHGEDVTHETPAGASTVVKAIFNEFIGAVDNQGRATFTISTLASNGIAAVEENDRFNFAGFNWTVVDVRDSEDNTAEIRCDRSKRR